MSTIAVILGKERRMVGRFTSAGAVGRENARPLEDLGVSRGLILRRLRERAVIREADHGHYYLDAESWAAVRRARRRAIHIAAAIALALLLVGLFGTRLVHAVPEGCRVLGARCSVLGSIVTDSAPTSQQRFRVPSPERIRSS